MSDQSKKADENLAETPQESKHNRRFILKMAATGALAAGAAGVAPVVSFGQCEPQPQPADKVPVEYPYAYTMSGCNALVDMNGWDAVYSFNVWGRFDITNNGSAMFTDLHLDGTFVSGMDHGAVSVRQVGECSGFYNGVKVEIQCPVEYTDATIGTTMISTLAIYGNVYQGGSDLTMQFRPDWPDDNRPPMVPIWSKATC